MSRTLSLLIGFGALLGSAPALTLPASGEPATMPLAGSEHVLFIGLRGDYRAVEVEEVRRVLVEDLEFTVLGNSLRALGNDEQRVWALRTAEPRKVVKALYRPMKKLGFEVEQLQASVFSPVGRVSGRELRRAMRRVEGFDEMIWTVWSQNRSGQVWVFHEDRRDADTIEKFFREAKVTLGYYHQEFDLTPSTEAEVDKIRDVAEEELDLLRMSQREKVLVLDLYMRDMDSMLVLDKERRTFICPDVIDGFLQSVPAGSLEWSVTLDNEGYPFVND